MASRSLLDPHRSYTFSNYFELGFAVDELVDEFDYSFERKFLNLTQYTDSLDRIEDLRAQIEEILPCPMWIWKMRQLDEKC